MNENEVADRAGLRDFGTEIGLIIAVPILLAAIHYTLSGGVKHDLAFSHERFSVYTLFTAAYVHAGQLHLLGNIVGYLLATVYTYMLCAAVDERRWFWRTWVVFLGVLPILVSLTSYAVFSTWFPSASPSSRGFSGVVAGFSGFLLVALAVYVKKRYSTQLGSAIGVSSFLVLMAVIDYIYSGRVRIVIAGLLAAGIGLQAGNYVWQAEFDLGGLDLQRVALDGAAVVLVFVVLGTIIVAMFPADIVQNGTSTNIIAHAVGFLLGIGVSAVVKWGWQSSDYALFPEGS